jgi:hypothetical protein
LRPAEQPALGRLPLSMQAAPVVCVWLTDLAWPDVERLGLTSHVLDCERGEERFTVHPEDQDGVMPWREWADAHKLDRSARSALELGHRDGAAHWFVSSSPVWAYRTTNELREVPS